MDSGREPPNGGPLPKPSLLRSTIGELSWKLLSLSHLLSAPVVTLLLIDQQNRIIIHVCNYYPYKLLISLGSYFMARD